MSGCNCQSSPTVTVKTTLSPSDENSSTQISLYQIHQMDCAAEEQLIRIKLSRLDQVQHLEFDFPQRKLKVFHDGDTAEITAQLESLGLDAKFIQQLGPALQSTAAFSSRYHIPQMDCYAEEQMVRLALAPIQTIHHLEFDLLQRTLDIQHNGDATLITTTLEKLALGATLESTQSIHVTTHVPASHQQQQRKVLLTLLAINAILFFIEFITGILAASSGLIADSLDMFADAAVYGIALYVVGKASKYQLRAAHISGWLQLVLALSVALDVVRRFLFGSEPDGSLMMIISLVALFGNAVCLYLISGHKEDGVHMKASWIFSSTDVMVNIGVIMAGVLVYFTHSAYPDLIIGSIIILLVLNGAGKILALK